ncbi:serine hydrolase domain-containing protein [Vagococcus carniphilus]|uniref:Penicillin-binding protein n=1 Tax=Vagococcus carniphilus TaxID=218144 RepID=A0A430AQ57_9ENTE|nr:serine hydrolase domain-containing protein [Vagococcus carniphilus]QNN72563.1 beta-lactamase family protein [Vagococcus carniphilus]RSU10196.1 penicillin-binding protein [Vagococcus carniphilus]
MNKKILLTIISIPFFFIFSTTTYAINQNQSVAIQNLLDEACKKSNTPGISVAIVSEKETSFFSSGYSNLDKKIPADEQTIFELASVSKAFTALGILKLEKQGLLSRTDKIQDYLPWLAFNYRGKSVDMNQLTINNFLNHTSGLTNRKHSATIPEGNSPDMLEKTVKNIKQADLAFLPGESHEYGTINYDILGLLIEVVSGKNYEEFMTSEIFQPLNLKNTYVTSNEIKNSESLSLGYRSFFFHPLYYEAPEFRGNTPAGYLLSNSKDLARWMSIQLNQTTDIPN